MTKIRPCRPGDLDALMKQAAEDGHAVVAPNFIVEQEGQTLGYLGLNTIPSAIVWMDTRLARVRHSYAVMNFYENMLRCGGADRMFLPCPTTSPFHPLLPKAGYKSFGEQTIYYKEL